GFARRRLPPAPVRIAPACTGPLAPRRSCNPLCRRSKMLGSSVSRWHDPALRIPALLLAAALAVAPAGAALLEVHEWSGSGSTWVQRDTPRHELAEAKSSGAGWHRIDAPIGVTILVESLALTG